MTVFQVELSVDSPFLSLNENVADSWKQEDTPVPTFLFLFCLRQTSNKPVTAARGKKKISLQHIFRILPKFSS